MSPSGFPANLAPAVLSILRIVSGYLFLLHGSAKHLKLPFVEALSKLPPTSLPAIAGWMELIGGALLVLGLFTRPVAFLLSGLMAVAYFMAHAPQAPLLPLLNGGELAVLYCFVFLYLSVAGGGPWGIDALRSKR